MMAAADEDRIRLLVGVDDSAQSIEALRWAARMARVTGAELHVGCAWYEADMDGVAAPSQDPIDYESSVQSHLHQLAAQVVDDGLALTAHALRGTTSHALESAAERLAADLLVIGAARNGVLSRALGVPLSATLAERPRRALAIVPHAAAPQRWDRWVVMVGVNGSATSSRALQWAGRTARAGGGRVIAVHAFDPSIPDPMPLEQQSLFEETSRRLRREWCAPLRDLGVEHDVELHAGEPVQVIAAAADAAEPACVVVGCSERGSLRRKIFGGVARSLFEAARWPIVIIPTPNDRPQWPL